MQTTNASSIKTSWFRTESSSQNQNDRFLPSASINLFNCLVSLYSSMAMDVVVSLGSVALVIVAAVKGGPTLEADDAVTIMGAAVPLIFVLRIVVLRSGLPRMNKDCVSKKGM
jgi:hypothetical protein